MFFQLLMFMFTNKKSIFPQLLAIFLLSSSLLASEVLNVSAKYGSAEVLSNGKIKYTPTPNFSGTDKVIYKISDGMGGYSESEVIVTVNSVNDAPIANDFSTSALEDSAYIHIDFESNTSDPDSGNLIITPLDVGVVGLITTSTTYTADGPKHKQVYKPKKDWNGMEQIIYTASDGLLNSNEATVNITVIPVDDAPVANNDILVLDVSESSKLIDVLVNDEDVDNDIANATILSANAVHGEAQIEGQLIRYTPPMTANSGLDEIQYSISLNNKTASAKVFIEIKDQIGEILNDIVLPFNSTLNSKSPTKFIYDATTQTLPSKINGNDINWSSSEFNFNIIKKDSINNYVVFTHPTTNQNPKTINLTASINVNGKEASRDFPVTLNPKEKIDTPALLIRVKYPETDFHQYSTHLSDYKRMFNDDVSIADYFIENSAGRSNIIPAILPQSSSTSIVDNDLNDGVVEYHYPTAQENEKFPSSTTIENILNALDSYIDFSNFDTNSDGIVQSTELAIMFNFATCNRANGDSLCYPGSSTPYDYSVPGFWPAATTGYYIYTNDGVRIGGSKSSMLAWVTDYRVPKTSPDSKIIEKSINILAHELGHSLYAQPDLYSNTTLSSPYTQLNMSIGKWGLMGSPYGSYNGVSMPQHYTANTKIRSGFIDPIYSTPFSRAGKIKNKITNFTNTDYAPLIISNNTGGQASIINDQYIAADVRSKENGFDRALPSSPQVDGVSLSMVNPSRNYYGNVSAKSWLQLNQNIISTDEKPETSYSLYSTLFVPGSSISDKTKFHDLSGNGEHTKSLGFTIPTITRTSPGNYEIEIINN